MANQLVRVPRRLERCRSLLEEIVEASSKKELMSLLANIDTQGQMTAPRWPTLDEQH